MAVRLACPACGGAFTPKPADAGRVVPCPRCGSDLQMPDAAPPTAKVATRRPARERDDEDEERPVPRAAGGQLLLLTLVATGATGLFLGAGVFLFAFRDRPAPPEPVAQKPVDPPLVNAPPPAVPKVELPKVEPPKVEQKAVPPKVEAKVPRVPGLPGVPDAVAAANAIPGLKFHLAFDRFEGGRPVEAVSGKPVGTGFGLAVTDGPRGDAVRLTHDRKQDNRHALDLSDAKGQFTIPADRPFTLTFWARRVNADAASGFGAFLIDAQTDHAERNARSFYLQLLPTTPALAAVKLLDMAHRTDPTVRTVQPTFRVADPTAWSHYAIIRGADRSATQLLVNGFEAPSALPQLCPGELRFDQIGLLRSAEGKTTVDLDELCLFDRVLTADEIAALGGRKAAAPPVPPPVEVVKLPAGAVPPATAFKGLKFYLPCDAIAEGGALAEAVSGKNVGRGQRLELIDGPRGKAVRATAGGLGATREGFDLTAQVDALAVGEGKPFTLAVWVRTDNWENIGGYFVDGKFGAADKFRALSLYRYTKGVGFLLQQGKPGGGADAINQLARGTFETPPRKDWIHLALTRDEKGTVRMAVDGAGAVVSKGEYTAELRFNGFSLMWQQGQNFVADFDEFCLFDRVLTDEELALLAGQKGKAVAVRPEEKEPPRPPVGPKDPPPVPAPMPKDALPVAPPPRAVVAAVEPPAIGPKDPPAPAPAAVAVSAPAGADPKGLLLYLPFDEAKDGQVREGVSGKFAGKCEGVELVKGVRGKAARLVAERADGAAGALRLDFSDLADRTAVPAGKPFALALWLRAEAREAGEKVSGTAVQFGVRPDRDYDRALQIGYGSAGTLHSVVRTTPDRLDAKGESAARWAGVANPAKWLHFAVVRDEKNAVRWYVNGKSVPQAGKPDPTWDGPLGFDRLFVGDPEQAKAVLEVDELCLFDRPLTADELKKLAEPPK